MFLSLSRNYLLPLSFLAAACAGLVSCSDTPAGKFKDNEKDKDNALAGGVNFINHAPAPWQKDWSTQNTVVFHWRGEPDNLHPTNGKSGARRSVFDYTQRFLIGTDLEKLSLRPDLIKELPTISANELEYTYELREEPTWDNGERLTAADVLFTLKASLCQYTNNGFAKPYFEYIREMRIDPANPRKFVIVMSQKYIQNVAVFSDMAIMQSSYHDKGKVFNNYSLSQLTNADFYKTPHPDLEAWAKEFNDNKYGRDINNLNGLGAYKVTDWQDKQSLELTRKPNHWTSKLSNATIYDASFPEKIIFRIIGDEAAIALEFQNQKIDASYWVSTPGLVELRKKADFNRNYASEFMPNYNYQYLGMNMKPQAVNRKPFFVDKRVRQAMAMLIPVEKMNNTFFEGKANRMATMVSPLKKDVINTNLKPRDLDIEAAKKLLDEAGWKDTDGDNIRDKMIDGQKVKFSFELTYMTGSPIFNDVVKMITDEIRKAGVEANPRTQEFARFYELMEQHDFDMALAAWNGSFFADDYKQIWHSNSWNNKGSNFVGFGTPESDKLIDEIRSTTNDSARIAKEKRLQEIVYDEQPYVFLFSNVAKVVIHRRFDNNSMYYEKPGIWLSNLRLNNTGGVTTKTGQ
ncbi:MAG: ABC transporter substrate-binding protein [Bacteroidota bacterium]